MRILISITLRSLLFLPLFTLATFSFAQNAGKSANPVKPIVLPSIEFKSANPVKPKDGSMITKDQMIVLDKIAVSIKENPEGNIKVSGHGGADKDDQQSSWEQVNAIIRYLVEKKGISPSRFIFDYGSEGNPNTVDLLFTTESGPKSQPQPHPNLRRNL